MTEALVQVAAVIGTLILVIGATELTATVYRRIHDRITNPNNSSSISSIRPSDYYKKHNDK